MIYALHCMEQNLLLLFATFSEFRASFNFFDSEFIFLVSLSKEHKTKSLITLIVKKKEEKALISKVECLGKSLTFQLAPLVKVLSHSQLSLLHFLFHRHNFQALFQIFFFLPEDESFLLTFWIWIFDESFEKAQFPSLSSSHHSHLLRKTFWCNLDRNPVY